MILNVAGLVLTRQEVWPQELSHNGGSLQDAPALRRCFHIAASSGRATCQIG
jgi:hypothetical protein